MDFTFPLPDDDAVFAPGFFGAPESPHSAYFDDDDVFPSDVGMLSDDINDAHQVHTVSPTPSATPYPAETNAVGHATSTASHYPFDERTTTYTHGPVVNIDDLPSIWYQRGDGALRIQISSDTPLVPYNETTGEYERDSRTYPIGLVLMKQVDENGYIYDRTRIKGNADPLKRSYRDETVSEDGKRLTICTNVRLCSRAGDNPFSIRVELPEFNIVRYTSAFVVHNRRKSTTGSIQSRVRKILKTIQWCPENNQCHACNRSRDVGHSDDCTVLGFLRSG